MSVKVVTEEEFERLQRRIHNLEEYYLLLGERIRKLEGEEAT